MSDNAATAPEKDTRITDLIEKMLVPEETYETVMNERVIPYLNERKIEKQLAVSGGKNLHLIRYACTSDNVSGSVLIVHGFTETTEKYREFAYYLLNLGYDVVVYDQRGHGFSDRDVDEMQLTHIDKFETYVDDLDAVVEAELKDSTKPLFLFAHSMGGAVAGLYLEKHPDGPFCKAILSSPMIAPDRGGFPLWVSKAMTGTFVAFGQKKKRLFLSKAPEGREKAEEAANNSVPRFEFYQDVKQSRPEYSNNGPTYGWTLESLKVTKKLLKKGEPEKISIPVMLYVADGDTTVIKEDIEQFAERVQNGELKRAVNCRHEIYYGPNYVLTDYLYNIAEFLQK
ncbi:MAG: alpha/beta hydrolase [Clostridia bacterium]|nr:alpha/beta hydrolase [Clostridia bacterium]